MKKSEIIAVSFLFLSFKSLRKSIGEN